MLISVDSEFSRNYIRNRAIELALDSMCEWLHTKRSKLFIWKEIQNGLPSIHTSKLFTPLKIYNRFSPEDFQIKTEMRIKEYEELLVTVYHMGATDVRDRHVRVKEVWVE